jgi:hypothetical protein
VIGLLRCCFQFGVELGEIGASERRLEKQLLSILILNGLQPRLF